MSVLGRPSAGRSSRRVAFRWVNRPQRLTTDLWQRRASPPRYYLRHFFHVSVTESRDRWTHTVTGEGSERGIEYEFSWVELPLAEEFALALDDYVHKIDVESIRA